MGRLCCCCCRGRRCSREYETRQQTLRDVSIWTPHISLRRLDTSLYSLHAIDIGSELWPFQLYLLTSWSLVFGMRLIRFPLFSMGIIANFRSRNGPSLIAHSLIARRLVLTASSSQWRQLPFVIFIGLFLSYFADTFADWYLHVSRLMITSVAKGTIVMPIYVNTSAVLTYTVLPFAVHFKFFLYFGYWVGQWLINYVFHLTFIGYIGLTIGLSRVRLSWDYDESVAG